MLLAIAEVLSAGAWVCVIYEKGFQYHHANLSSLTYLRYLVETLFCT
jgi:hypothetical protein